MGPMIVTADGATQPNGRPEGVDREFIVSFHEVDEHVEGGGETSVLSHYP